MLAQALLSQKHRLILKFQRMNLVETSSSSSDSDDNNYDTLRLMENKNALVRLTMYGKLKKMIRGFTGRDLDPLEQNMIRGLFIRKLKDFAEEQREVSENHSLLQRLLADLKLRPAMTDAEIGSPQKKGDTTINPDGQNDWNSINPTFNQNNNNPNGVDLDK